VAACLPVSACVKGFFLSCELLLILIDVGSYRAGKSSLNKYSGAQ